VIDWLTLLAPMPHAAPICSGHVVSIDSSGAVEWQSVKRHTVKGSFATGLQVRTATHTADRCSHVEISGNPVKFFQGHNLFGTDDLPALALATLEHVARILGIEVSAETRAAWVAGQVQITRTDCTESFHLANAAEVLAWLRAAEQTAHLSHRGRGQLVKGSTLYFGKNSRRWSLKLYAKGQEIQAKGHGQDSILQLPAAMEWAGKTLRAELTLRSLELKRRGLSFVRDWLPVDGVPFVTSELLREKLGTMTMTTTAHLSPAVIESLRPTLRMAVHSWESGIDLRKTLPRPTFYKYRAELLPLGIDIAMLMPKEVSNVVPLYRVLEAKPAAVPDWAIGTALYFEPRWVA
jgi:II/X family phage/plasmid replication protein